MALDGALAGDQLEPSLVEIPQPEEDQISKDEKLIGSIVYDSKWEPLKEYFQSRVDYYQKALDEAIGPGDDFALIGQKALVLSILRQEMEQAKAKVEMTAESIREERQ